MDTNVSRHQSHVGTRWARQAGLRSSLVAAVVLGLLLVSVRLLVAPAAGVSVDPGVAFQPSGSWASLSFGSPQTFSTVRLDMTGVTFDSVRFGMVKSPAGLPRATLVMSTWSPLQTTANGTVLDFTGDAPSGSALVFSLSNVIPGHEYVLQVDGAEVSRPLSNQTGFVWFTWSSFSTHEFKVLLGWRTGLPPPPTPLSADFTYAPTTPGSGQTVAFTAVAAGGYPPYVYAWQFGDGSTGSGANASHAYLTGGNYTAVLTVVDVSERTASASHVVSVQQVAPPPTLTASLVFTPTQPHVGDSVSFSSAVSGGTPPYAYSWTFGDGAAANTASPVHVYAAVGSYVVNLTVQDAASAMAQASERVVVIAAPPSVPGNVTAAFDFTIDGSTVSFVDRSRSDAGLPIVRHSWFFGDGSSSTEEAPVHVYALSGLSVSYTVWLTAYDSAGHIGTAARVVTLVNWPLVLLLVVVVAAIATAIALVWRRRRKQQKSTKARTGRDRGPPRD